MKPNGESECKHWQFKIAARTKWTSLHVRNELLVAEEGGNPYASESTYGQKSTVNSAIHHQPAYLRVRVILRIGDAQLLQFTHPGTENLARVE